MGGKIIFITGTDTGVGKTIFTGLLLTHLRTQGVHALAMKPFCSGGLDDVEILSALQNHELSREEMNPYYFDEPVAPLIAARKHHRMITISDVLRRIQAVKVRCEVLLIEGAGGLLSPLGEGFTARDLISKLRCGVVCVARNKLGTINHCLLVAEAMQGIDTEKFEIVLMGMRVEDESSPGNRRILKDLLATMKVWEIPWLEEIAKTPMKSRVLELFNFSAKKIKKTLAQFYS